MHTADDPAVRHEHMSTIDVAHRGGNHGGRVCVSVRVREYRYFWGCKGVKIGADSRIRAAGGVLDARERLVDFQGVRNALGPVCTESVVAEAANESRKEVSEVLTVEIGGWAGVQAMRT